MEKKRVKPSSRTPKQRPLSRKAKLIGLGIGFLLIWQILVNSLPAGHQDSEDQLAADYASTSEAAATTAASQRLIDGDPTGAKVFATRGLAFSSISASSLRDLGLAEQSLGDASKAGSIFSQAAALGWRDTPTQIWLAQAFLQQREYDAASQRMDGLLRVKPQSAALFELLDRQVTDPNFAKAIANRLVFNPNWRLNYFRSVNYLSVAGLLAKADILKLLSQTASPPSTEQIAPTLIALIRTDHAEVARNLWLGLQRSAANGVFDPYFKFTRSDDASPFQWSILPVSGVNIFAIPNGTGNIIRIDADGASSGTVLHQTTALSPGMHELAFTGTIPEAARSEIFWTVRCLKSGRILLSTAALKTLPPYNFNVPSDCNAQQVALLAAGGTVHNIEANFSKFEIN